MTMIMTAVALAAAQGQPAATPPQTGHAQHQQMQGGQHADHQQAGEAKEGDCCCKGGKCDMPCCAKKDEGGKKPDAHQGHDG